MLNFSILAGEVPFCRKVTAALEPFHVIQSATVVSLALRTLAIAEGSGEAHLFLDRAHTDQLKKSAREFLVYLDERRLAGEDVPPQLRDRVERLTLYVPLTGGLSLARHEFEPLSEDIHEWFRLRRLSRMPNLLE